MNLSCTRIEAQGACYPTLAATSETGPVLGVMSLEYSTISHNAYGQIRLVMHDGMTFRDHSLPTRQEHTYGLWDIVL